ncbi:MAG: hypothetical protein HQL02_11105 [Nitrospirae bacterium]|nr:hypothetical protein [Nitrospirota bacterium]
MRDINAAPDRGAIGDNLTGFMSDPNLAAYTKTTAFEIDPKMGEGLQAKYNAEKKVMTINPVEMAKLKPAEQAFIIAHEYTHALTKATIDGNKDFSARLDSLRQQSIDTLYKNGALTDADKAVIADLGDQRLSPEDKVDRLRDYGIDQDKEKLLYSLSDNNEFVAHAVGDPHISALLRKSQRGKGLFQRIVNTGRAILGFRDNGTYAQTMRTMADVINANIDQDSAFGESLRVQKAAEEREAQEEAERETANQKWRETMNAADEERRKQSQFDIDMTNATKARQQNIDEYQQAKQAEQEALEQQQRTGVAKGQGYVLGQDRNRPDTVNPQPAFMPKAPNDILDLVAARERGDVLSQWDKTRLWLYDQLPEEEKRQQLEVAPAITPRLWTQGKESQPRTAAETPTTPAKLHPDTKQRLKYRGYTDDDIAGLTPTQIDAIIRGNIRRVDNPLFTRTTPEGNATPEQPQMLSPEEIAFAKSFLETAQAGSRIHQWDDEDHTVTGASSTFPSWFKQSGVDKTGAMRILDKLEAGQSLPDVQQRVVDKWIKQGIKDDYAHSEGREPEEKYDWGDSYSLKAKSDRIGDLYDKVVEDRKNRRPLDLGKFFRISLGKVSGGNVQAVKAATGIDLTGYERTIDSNHIKHILIEHSDPKREAARGQRVVTKEDIQKIPEIVESPTKISLGKTKRGLDAIIYEKKINGYTYYIEEVRTRKHNIATTTMYIKSEGGSNVAPSQDTPTLNVQDVPPTDSIVPRTGEPVKGQGGQGGEDNASYSLSVPKENRLPLSEDDLEFLDRPDTDLIRQSIHKLGLSPWVEPGDHKYITPNGKILNTRYHSDIGFLFDDMKGVPDDEVLNYMNMAQALRVWATSGTIHAEFTEPPTSQQVSELLRTIGTGKDFDIEFSSPEDRTPVNSVRGFGASEAREKLQTLIDQEFGGRTIDAYTGESYSIAGHKAKGFENAKKEDRTFEKDGFTRYEIPNMDATVKQPQFKAATIGIQGEPILKTTLGDILEHYELYQEYPWLKGVQVRFQDLRPTLFGLASKTLLTNKPIITLNAFRFLNERKVVDPNAATLNEHEYRATNGQIFSLRTTLLHEAQHVIQVYEGFPRGSTIAESGSRSAYEQNPGEMESRYVERRARMTPEQYAATPTNADSYALGFGKPNTSGSPDYDKLEDKWLGEKAVRHLEARNEARDLQSQIQAIAGERTFGAKSQLIDKALHLYIDTKRYPDDLTTKYPLLNEQQRATVDFMRGIQN